MSSLGSKVLCIMICFLSLWASSSLFHFKSYPGSLTRSTPLVFIPFISFLLQSSVSFVWYPLLQFFLSLLLLLLSLLLFTPWEFSTSVLADGFSLEFEWQVCRTCLSILAVFSKAVICIVSKSTNHNWHNRHFHDPQLFQFSSKVLLFTLFRFYSVVSWDSKVDNFANSLFLLLIIIRSGLQAEIKWSVSMSKSHRSLCVSFTGQVLGGAYTICWYGQI